MDTGVTEKEETYYTVIIVDYTTYVIKADEYEVDEDDLCLDLIKGGEVVATFASGMWVGIYKS